MTQSIGTITSLRTSETDWCTGLIYDEKINLTLTFKLAAEELARSDLRVGDRVAFKRNYSTSTASEISKEILSSPDAGGVGSKSDRKLWSLGVAAVFGAVWLYNGMPNPVLMLSSGAAEQSCLELANENLDSLLPMSTASSVSVLETWLKNGRRVVELQIEEAGSSDFHSRICVYGRGTVKIVSIIEEGRWY